MANEATEVPEGAAPPPGYVLYQPPAPPAAAPQSVAQAAPQDAPPLDGPPPGYVLASPPAADTAASPTAAKKPVQELRSHDSITPNRRFGKPILDDRELAATNMGIARASLPTDVQGQIKRFSEHFGVPESFFGVVDGDIVRWVPEQNAYAKVVPTLSGADGVLETAARIPAATANLAGPAIPTIAGAVAGAAAGPTAGSIPAAGIAAGAADLARQGLDKAISGEPVSALGSYDYGHAAGEAVMNAGGQAVGVGIGKMLPFNSNPLKLPVNDRLAAVPPAQRAEWTALSDEAQRRGVDLSVDQVAGLPSLQQRMRQMGRDPEMADALGRFRTEQNTRQVPAAVNAELDSIAPAAGREAQIASFNEGADNVVGRALNERSAEARVAYRQALDNKAPFINDEAATLLQSRPSMRQAWVQAQRLAAERGEPLPQLFNADMTVTTVPDWRAWDYIKQGMDAVIDKNKNAFGKLNATGNAVNNTKKELLAILDAQNPEWVAARAKYGNSSDAVDMILEGGVGFIRKMEGPERQLMVNRVFQGGNLLPEEVARMRSQFEAAGNLPDWNNGVRAFIEGRLDKAMRSDAQGKVGNVPGKLFADLWGNEPQKRVLTAAIGDPARVEGMEGLFKVLQAAARQLPEGSPTATDSGMKLLTAAGPVLKGVGKLTSPSTYLDAGNVVVDMISKLREPEAKRKLVEYMLSDAAINDLARTRSLSPTSLKAINAVANIGTKAGIVGLSADEPDFEPAETQRLRGVGQRK